MGWAMTVVRRSIGNDGLANLPNRSGMYVGANLAFSIDGDYGAAAATHSLRNVRSAHLRCGKQKNNSSNLFRTERPSLAGHILFSETRLPDRAAKANGRPKTIGSERNCRLLQR